MTPLRIGSYAPSRGAARRGVRVTLRKGDEVTVENEDAALPFYRNAAQAGAQEFARILLELAEHLAQRQAASDDDAALGESLTLDDALRQETLDELRMLGSPLSSKLHTSELGGLLRDVNVMDGGPPLPEVTFADKGGAPILWDMLYDGRQSDDLDWERFWGFRVPITHWLGRNSPCEISLRGGVFAALNEELRFAGAEVDDLVGGHPGCDVQPMTLAMDLRRQVEAALADRPEELQPAGEAWLVGFLDAMSASGDAFRAKQWLRKALVATLSQAVHRDVLHFACHCQPSAQTEFLSQLDMTVAGQQVSLEAAVLADLTKDRRRATGPFVFLNACGTAQANMRFEPPGFPTQWIESGGAVAVLATLCPIPDYFALVFARRFYNHLFAAMRSGAASPAVVLLETRRYFMERHGNPLGLAYVLYADKGTEFLA